jgi:acyl-CoA synthetase (AMP-forming)/AMP-acid ligase II
VTGDLVQVDKEGFIHFAVRLKRFIKVNGEMVPMAASLFKAASLIRSQSASQKR